MEKKLLFFGAVGMLAAGIYSCSQEGEVDLPPPEPPVSHLVQRARTFFEAVYSPEVKTRTAVFQPATVQLSSMEVDPDWEHSLYSENDSTAYLEFPLLSDERLGITFGGEPANPDEVVRTVDRRLVVREDKATGEMELFTSLWIPDDEADQTLMPGLTLLDVSDFSGRIYLFYPDGQFYQGAGFSGGEIVSSLTVSEAAYDSGPQTRARVDIKNCRTESGLLWEQTCYYQVPHYTFISCTDWKITGHWTETHCTTVPGTGTGFPGGGTTSPGDGHTTSQRPAGPNNIEAGCIFYADEIRAEMGEHVNMFKGIDRSNHSPYIYADFLAAIAANGSVEHAISIQNWGGSETGLDFLSHGTSGTQVELGYNDYTVGTIHSHPNGSAPSARDLITTGQIAGEANNFQSSVIYDPSSGGFWVIYVEDASRAAAFAARYAADVDPVTNDWKSGSPVANHLTSNDFQKFSGAEKQAFELANVLDKFSSGMRLVSVSAHGRTETYGVKKKGGYRYLTPLKCSDSYTGTGWNPPPPTGPSRPEI